MNVTRTADGGFEVVTDRGTSAFRFPAKTVLRSHATGHATSELTKFQLVEMSKHIESMAGKKVYYFADAWELTSYDGDVAGQYAEWLKLHKKSLGCFLVLQRSRLIALSAKFVNLLVGGGVDLVSDREAFERKFEQVLAQEQGKP